ncbi:MAG: hypothetical protein IJC16_09460 [Rikenellaceae bacterium]|nr:hypothetical protein [Rikenellaceae bacterium]
MLIAGYYYALTVNRVSDYGLYLADDTGEEVLLPNRYVSAQMQPGDTVDVFVYHDSEDRLVATTEHPYATVGQAAHLRVVGKTIHGAFLDWGLTAKDLFVPNRNQLTGLVNGHSYIVYLYSDNVTGRVVGSTRLTGFISNSELTVRSGEQVDLLVAIEQERGFRVIVNNRHWGMIYYNQLFRPVAVGDRLTGYVSKITDDNRIDISLQQAGYDEVRASAQRLLNLLAEHSGYLPLNDHSDPDEIAAVTRMSKKVFKRSVGTLLRQGALELTGEGIRLRKRT